MSYIENKVIKIVEHILECKITLNCNRENHKLWDSLKHIDIMFTIEEEFGITLSAEDMNEMSSVIDIVKKIQNAT